MNQRHFQTSSVAPRKGGHFSIAVWLVALLLWLKPAHADPIAARSLAQPAEWTAAIEHIRNGRTAAALPYLEALVRAYPKTARYRLELAAALYLLKRDARAQYHFTQVRGANLTPAERRVVDQALARIAERKRWSARLSFSIQPSSNAGRGTAASTIDIGGYRFRIPGNLRSKPATGLVVGAGATFRPRIGENLEASFSIDALIKYYNEKVLRETILIGRSGLRWSPRQNVFVEGGLLYGTTYAGGARYRDRVGVYGNYTTRLGKRASARIGFETYEMSHETRTRSDGRRSQISASMVYALTGQMLLRGRGYVQQVNANSPLQAGWNAGLTLGTTFAFEGGLVANLDVTGGIDRRDGINRLTGARRSDRSLTISAEFFNSQYQIGRFTPVLQMRHEENRSNEVLNSYSNSSINIGLRSSF